MFANGPGSEIEQLEAVLHGRRRQATRAVMVLLSLHGLAAPQIAELPRPLTRSDAGYRRALDQPLATAGLRAELLECAF